MIEDTRMPNEDRWNGHFVCEICERDLTEDDVIELRSVHSRGSDIQVCEDCEQKLIEEQKAENYLKYREHRTLVPIFDGDE